MDIHNAIARWEGEGGAVPQAQTLRQRFNALALRQVLAPIDFSPESLQLTTLIASEQKSARAEMENLREAISRKGGTVETKVALGSPAEQIGKYVRKAGVDLIITSTHGRSDCVAS